MKPPRKLKKSLTKMYLSMGGERHPRLTRGDVVRIQSAWCLSVEYLIRDIGAIFGEAE